MFRLQDGDDNPVDAFCIEPGISLNLSRDFETNVSTAMNSAQLGLVQKLYDSSFRDVTSASSAAAFQLALWEIAAEDGTPDDTTVLNLASGNHRITRWQGSTRDLGNTFLSRLSQDWDKQYSLTTYENGGQDLVSASPVPLPASALLLLFGVGGFAAMRRRKAPIA